MGWQTVNVEYVCLNCYAITECKLYDFTMILDITIIQRCCIYFYRLQIQDHATIGGSGGILSGP